MYLILIKKLWIENGYVRFSINEVRVKPQVSRIIAYIFNYKMHVHDT
jgi:hypothetical protein